MNLEHLSESILPEVIAVRLLATKDHITIAHGGEVAYFCQPEFYRCVGMSAEEEDAMSSHMLMVELSLGRCPHCVRRKRFDANITLFFYIVDENPPWWPKHWLVEFICESCVDEDVDGVAFLSFEDALDGIVSLMEGKGI